MSGGSHQYLYSNPPLVPDELLLMAKEASEEGFQFCAAELDAIIALYRVLNERWELLETFMSAFEWWKSGDVDKEYVTKAEQKIISMA